MKVQNIDYSIETFYKHNPEQQADMYSTIPENYLYGVRKYSQSRFLGYRAGLSGCEQAKEQFEFLTYEQSTCYVKQLTQQLLNSGLQKGDRVIIYASNSPLWLLSDIAISFAGGITVPIYDTLGVDNIIYCANLSEAKYVIVSKYYFGNIMSNLQKFQTLQSVISLDQLNDDKIHLIENISNLSNSTISNSGEIQDQSNDNISSSPTNKNKILSILQFHEDNIENSIKFLEQRVLINNLLCSDINAVVFTSGTSGRPKGIILSHQNLLQVVTCQCRQLVPDSTSECQGSILSYLPLAHMYERSSEHGVIPKGYAIYYQSGSIKNIVKDIQLSKPVVLVGVPRVFVKIHEQIMNKINKSPFPVKLLFKTAYRIKYNYLKKGLRSYNNQKHFTDRIFKVIQDAIGNPQVITCGSAVLPGNVREFLEVTSGAKLSIGYTMSEAGGCGFINYAGQVFNDDRQIGYPGYLTEAKLVDRSDICEYSLDHDQIGELKLKGLGIAVGYINEKWGNIQCIVDSDGFFSSGDLGRMNKDGSISFVKRLGLNVKLQQGEFVDLEAIELALEQAPLINQAFAYADCDKSAPVAFVSINSNILIHNFGVNIIDQFNNHNENAVQSINSMLKQQGEQAIRKSGLKGFNVPRAYKIYIDKDWSSNSDFYTPTQKKKHSPFVKAHENELKELYCSLDQNIVVTKINSKKPKLSNNNKLIIATVLVISMFIFVAVMSQ
ncbi:Long_chain fatty acid CoA ligase [Hexamita inflata]|uniref:Long chain fatty acid CoA ligase n=1 Tax=Hexamita inflata TaxID=28002 RepID=A0AA86RB08_9EUKA|nr:Long chain fatty acid CoA ligase [Hexamita inflata]